MKDKYKISEAHFIVYKRVMEIIFDIEKTSQQSYNKFFESFYTYIGRNYFNIDMESDSLEIDEVNDEVTKEVLNSMLAEIMSRHNDILEENEGLLNEIDDLTEENEELMSEVKSLKMILNSLD